MSTPIEVLAHTAEELLEISEALANVDQLDVDAQVASHTFTISRLMGLVKELSDALSELLMEMVKAEIIDKLDEIDRLMKPQSRPKQEPETGDA